MKAEESKLWCEKGIGPEVGLFAKGTGRDMWAGGARDYGKGGGGDRKRYTGDCFYCKRSGHCRRDCRRRIADEGRGKKGLAGVDIAAQASGEKMWMTADGDGTSYPIGCRTCLVYRQRLLQPRDWKQGLFHIVCEIRTR